MPDLQDLLKVWFYSSPHTKSWLIDTTHFVVKPPRMQKGWIYIAHNYVEFHVYGQYRDVVTIPHDQVLNAADPHFFERLDGILKEMLL